MDGEVIVAFDGDCLMCSRGIRFLAEHDRHRRLRFLKLQSVRGRWMEERAGESCLRTMVVEDGDRIYARSGAILRCLNALGGIWSFLATLAALVPGRDFIYDRIAENRRRWFRDSSVCQMPSPALLERMLDGDGI